MVVLASPVPMAVVQDWRVSWWAFPGERSPLAKINPAAAAGIAIAESLTNLVSADCDSLDRVVFSANWMAASGSNIEDQALFDSVKRSERIFAHN